MARYVITAFSWQKRRAWARPHSRKVRDRLAFHALHCDVCHAARLAEDAYRTAVLVVKA